MQRFNKILCVLEHGEASKLALEKAAALAENNQAELTVVDVIPRISAGIGLPDGGPISQDLQVAMVQEQEKRMESMTEPYRQRLNVREKVLLGTPFLEVIREILRNGHDVVVKCPESPGWLDRFFSGDDMHLLRKCPCPVWFVKPHAPKTFRHILATVDVDDSYPPKELEIRQRLNVQIMETATSLAISESAILHVVHAWESVNEMVGGMVFSSDIPREKLIENIEQEQRQQQRLLDDFMWNLKSSSDAMREKLDFLLPLTHLLKGSARKEIPTLAKRLDVDCIVMGTVARTGIRGFIMGNTAEAILEQIECSVLAIKPEGFVTPVTLDQ